MSNLSSPQTETNPFRRKAASPSGTTTPPSIIPVQFSFDSAFETPVPAAATEENDPWAVRAPRLETSEDPLGISEADEKLAKLNLEEASRTKDDISPLLNPSIPESRAPSELPDVAPHPYEQPVNEAPISDSLSRRESQKEKSGRRAPLPPPPPPPPPPHSKRVDTIQNQTGGLKYTKSRRGPRPPPPPRPASRKGNNSNHDSERQVTATTETPPPLAQPTPIGLGVEIPTDASITNFSESSYLSEDAPVGDEQPSSDLRPPPLQRALPSSDSISSRRSIDPNPFRRMEPQVDAHHQITRAQTSPVEPTSSFSFEEVANPSAVPGRPQAGTILPTTREDVDPETLRQSEQQKAIDGAMASLMGTNDSPETSSPPAVASPQSRPQQVSRRSTYGSPTTRPSSSAGPPPPPPPARRISVRPSVPSNSSNRISRYGMPPPPPPPSSNRDRSGNGAAQVASPPPAQPTAELPKSDTDSAVGLLASPPIPETRPPPREKKEPKPSPPIPADLEIEGGESTAELDDDLEREILGLENAA